MRKEDLQKICKYINIALATTTREGIITPMKTTKKTPLEKALLAAIKDSGMTLNTLAQKAGICYAPVFHFATGQRSLTLPTAGKLAAALGLELVQRTEPKKTVKTGKRG